MQPYLSAVNKYFRDHQLQLIAIGDLLADARRGLEMLQHRLVPADTRLLLPAPVTLDILLAANTLRDSLILCSQPIFFTWHGHVYFSGVRSVLRVMVFPYHVQLSY
jgi:hypothetical protein